MKRRMDKAGDRGKVFHFPVFISNYYTIHPCPQFSPPHDTVDCIYLVL